MTVRGPYTDERHPGLPYAITIRYGTTNSLVEVHRYPTPGMAETAAEEIREHGLIRGGWPTHMSP